MTNVTLLLIALLVCHYLADYCLTSPSMIKAKANGRNPWPILSHASVHALLIGLCLLLWGIECKMLMLMMMAELISHFLIDTGKGRLTSYYPLFADLQKKPYWMLYGFDQLLHLLIIVIIWNYSIA